MSDPEGKARARAMWAAGDFPRVARDTIPEVGPALVEAAGVRTGAKVLDVAAGSGATSIPAALAGGDVIASDLTPELLEAGRHAAIAAGVAIQWTEADAEALPFADAAFDVVLSSFGAMFAPRHQVVADELLRVTRPGGTIAMANWTPEGWVGQMFLTLLPFLPPPPAGALPPVAWGAEGHVRTLFGEGVDELRCERRVQEITHFASPEETVEYYRTNFGPVIMAFANVSGDAGATAELELKLMDFATQTFADGAYAAEYLQVIARRA
jgi:ubiquinone/menaquinone biosynthesis C-methylase UbiE